jgi:hypothetical protein
VKATSFKRARAAVADVMSPFIASDALAQSPRTEGVAAADDTHSDDVRGKIGTILGRVQQDFSSKLRRVRRGRASISRALEAII